VASHVAPARAGRSVRVGSAAAAPGKGPAPPAPIRALRTPFSATRIRPVSASRARRERRVAGSPIFPKRSAVTARAARHAPRTFLTRRGFSAPSTPRGRLAVDATRATESASRPVRTSEEKARVHRYRGQDRALRAGPDGDGGAEQGKIVLDDSHISLDNVSAVSAGETGEAGERRTSKLEHQLPVNRTGEGRDECRVPLHPTRAPVTGAKSAGPAHP
jgi:hypothetical protein